MVEVIIMSQTFGALGTLIKVLALLEENDQLNPVGEAWPGGQVDLGLHLFLPVYPRHVTPEFSFSLLYGNDNVYLMGC